MKATELRIGNWVHDPNGKGADKTIRFKMISNWEVLNTAKWKPYQPIPLTHEWLEKFGFDVYQLKNRKRGYRNNFNINLFKRGDIKISYKHRQLSIDLKYVHQLQNLYFALTSEELQIKSDEKHPNN